MLIHTLLFMIRKNSYDEDILRVERCLKSLEKSKFKRVCVFNQGFWDNTRLQNYLKAYSLDCIVIGEGVNVGIVIGRQRCFEYVWQKMPQADFVTELHLDMIFSDNWENPLTEYLYANDEPVISCGIVDKYGETCIPDLKVQLPPINDLELMYDYLARLKQPVIVKGFTHPCVHRMDILKAVGGFDARFLKDKQAFEDDSLLLGYYYYYGTRANWNPKVNYRTVVYHETVGQRFGQRSNKTSALLNFNGLVKQYGAMGLSTLAELHSSPSKRIFYSKQFEQIYERNLIQDALFYLIKRRKEPTAESRTH